MIKIRGASVDDLERALALSAPDAAQWLNERRQSAKKLVEACVDTGEPHDWIACDVIDLAVDCICIKCRARFRWTMIPARTQARYPNAAKLHALEWGPTPSKEPT
jgi:hypothetical protein